MVAVDLTARREAEERNLTIATDELRSRIAEAVQNDIIHRLFGVAFTLQAAAEVGSDAELRSRLETAVAELDKAIAELRRHVFES